MHTLNFIWANNIIVYTICPHIAMQRLHCSRRPAAVAATHLQKQSSCKRLDVRPTQCHHRPP